MNDIGNTKEPDAMLEKYNKLSAEIESNQATLKQLQTSAEAIIPAEVSIFLKHSRAAMNLEVEKATSNTEQE